MMKMERQSLAASTKQTVKSRDGGSSITGGGKGGRNSSQHYETASKVSRGQASKSAKSKFEEEENFEDMELEEIEVLIEKA